MLILPAIDLRGGKCVRLYQGDYGRETVYADDPLEVAKRFEGQGAGLLHVVDLDGARQGYPANLEVVGKIAESLSIPVQFGGGIRSLAIAREALERGIHRVVIGSKLLDSPEFAESVFAILGESAAAGIDARNGWVATSGWTETSAVEAEALAKSMDALGARRFVVTDISRDGAMKGPNLEFLRSMSRAVRGKVIASGGVSTIGDLEALFELGFHNLEGVIVGKALYEGKLELQDAVRHFAAA
jgi:phosphoribosylformimino-5-aminoimidazole carboxamide ribotide isomerase